MQTISTAWLYPIILAAGALQAWRPPMNGAPRRSPDNHWLASTVSPQPIVPFLPVMSLGIPNPLPSRKGIGAIPRWAPLGGLIGAFAVVAGLLFLDKTGAGPFAGLTMAANIALIATF